jgi:hypothetical protein
MEVSSQLHVSANITLEEEDEVLVPNARRAAEPFCM